MSQAFLPISPFWKSLRSWYWKRREKKEKCVNPTSIHLLLTDGVSLLPPAPVTVIEAPDNRPRQPLKQCCQSKPELQRMKKKKKKKKEEEEVTKLQAGGGS